MNFKEIIKVLRLSGFSEETIRQMEIEDEVAKLTGSALLTNMSLSEAPIVLQAARELGFDIYIDQALDCNGCIMKNSIGVYTRERERDHGPFWKRVNAFRKEARG